MNRADLAHGSRRLRALACAVALACGGCFVFETERNHRVPADRCSEVDIELDRENPAGLSLSIDMRPGAPRPFADDINELVRPCVGAAASGNDAVIKVHMLEGEVWHTHLSVGRDPAGGVPADPVVYVLSGCPARACDSATSGRNLCGPGRDEHLSFVAPSTSDYYIGIDSVAPGGAQYGVSIYHSICGNGRRTDPEGCDDGNRTDGDGCDSECRTELRLDQNAETEDPPHEEPVSANLLAGPQGETSVVGAVTRCGPDWYAVSVPAGGSIRATLADRFERVCPAAGTIALDLFQDRGRLLRRSGTPAPDNAPNRCLEIGTVDAPERVPVAGTYLLRVSSTGDDVQPSIAYRLSVTVAPP
jgi:cysteine-rich repeat protein